MTDITPAPELVQQWGHNANLSGVPHNDEHWAYEQHIATCAAQWGADQELEACCLWVNSVDDDDCFGANLRAARRPKPPSLKELALALVEQHEDGWRPSPKDWDTIRRALEQLDD
jgi:hypothetical protein